MTRVKGHLVVLKVSKDSATPAKIAKQTDTELTITANTQDVTDKDCSVDATTGYLYPEEEITSISGQITCTCFKDDDAASAIQVGDTVSWALASGKDSYSGSALVTDMAASGSVNQMATEKWTLKTKGAITHTVAS